MVWRERAREKRGWIEWELLRCIASHQQKHIYCRLWFISVDMKPSDSSDDKIVKIFRVFFCVIFFCVFVFLRISILWQIQLIFNGFLLLLLLVGANKWRKKKYYSRILWIFGKFRFTFRILFSKFLQIQCFDLYGVLKPYIVICVFVCFSVCAFFLLKNLLKML